MTSPPRGKRTTKRSKTQILFLVQNVAYDNKFMIDYEVVKDQLPEEWHLVPTKPPHPKKIPVQTAQKAKLPPEWSAMEDRTGRWSKTSPRTSGPDIKPANVMEATKEETAAAVEKMKSEFAHVHDYLDGKTETSHNVRKRHQASQREDWEELPSPEGTEEGREEEAEGTDRQGVGDEG